MTLSEVLAGKGRRVVTVSAKSSITDAIRTMHAEKVGAVLTTADTLDFDASYSTDAEDRVAWYALEVGQQLLTIGAVSVGNPHAVIRVPAGSAPAAIEAVALADERIQARIAGKTVAKVIVIPGKTVNLVVK